MEIALPVGTKTMLAEAIVGEDGALHLKDTTRFSLKPGEKVVLTISPVGEVNSETAQPLLGTVTYYEDPFGPATTPEEWEALR